MPVPQGLFEMTGVQHLLSGRFTLAHGIRPSTGLLEIAPQTDPLPVTGDLTIRYESGSIVLRDCRLTQPAMRADDGVTIRVRVEDRRWKWAFCEPISGRYNRRDEHGQLAESTEKSPRELAELLLDRMGESAYDITGLPEFSRPSIDWDYAQPAEELARLCDQLGCRVVLQLDNTVAVRVAGMGASLPTEAPVLTDSLGLEDRSRPDSLLLVGSPRRVQSRFKLEAVGRDRDGEIRPLDELSYRPATGWQQVYPDSFSQLTSEEDRRLARATVYRWYRVVCSSHLDPPVDSSETSGSSGSSESDSSGGGIRYELPTLGSATRREAVLPLEAELFDTAVTSEGVVLPLPCRVFGEFVRGGYLPAWSVTNLEQNWESGFQIDCDQGIVRLDQPAVRLTEDGTIAPARLYLETVHAWRGDEQSQPERWTWRSDMPGDELGTGPAVLKRDDLAARLEVVYDPSGLIPTGDVIDNEDGLNELAEELFELLRAQWEASETREMHYAGLMAIEPDGAIRQVQWSVGPDGMQTRASRNSEFDRALIGYAEQRLWDRLQRTVAEAETERTGQRQRQRPIREGL